MENLFKWLFLISLSAFLLSCVIGGQPSFQAPSRPVTNTPFAPLFPTNPLPNPTHVPDLTSRYNPFPYKLVPDTFTALTCANSPANVLFNRHLFSLTAGAYYDHGLQLSEEFQGDYNITYNTSTDKVRRHLEQSIYRNARARLSLQDASQLSIFYRRSTDQDSSNMIKADFPPFNNNDTLDLLSRLQPVFTSRSPDRRDIQNSGNFKATLTLDGTNWLRWINQFSTSASGQLLLTLTYSGQPDGEGLSISNTSGRPYGRGYRLDFSDPYKADYLVNIQEEDLASTQIDGRWTCPRSLRFMVARSRNDISNPFNKFVDEHSNYFRENDLPRDREAYCQTGRALTRAEIDFFEREFGTRNKNNLPFYVGNIVIPRANSENGNVIDQPCIVFKIQNPNCYAGTSAENGSGGAFHHRIEFDPREQENCMRLHQLSDHALTNEERYKICPAFLSACYRSIPGN